MRNRRNFHHLGRRPFCERGSIALAFVIVGIFLAAGCLGGNPAFGKPAFANAPAGVHKAQRKGQGKGQFKFAYPPVKNKEYVKWRKEFKEAKVLESIATDLNSTIALPVDVTLIFTECGEPNAFYDPETHQLSMCYELIESFYDAFSEEAKSEESLDNEVLDATVFVFFHELGHALIHVLDLPITGKEEDVVDQLATYIVTDGTDEGETVALNGALSFYLASQKDETNIEDLAFWDEHSLGLQRFYNIICLIYGQNEDKYAALVTDGILPEDRAARCGSEYAQVEKAWKALLGPHLK